MVRSFFAFVLFSVTVFGQTSQPASQPAKSVAEQLQDVSVTLTTGSSEGSGVIVKRGEENYVLTAAHVIANLRKTRSVIDSKTGSERKIVEFDDANVVQTLYEDGRKVGKIEMLATVLCYSDADNGEDLAVLKVQKKNFINASAVFYLQKEPAPVGSDLYHVGSLRGQFGSNSVTTGIISQIGRVYENKVYDQTSCPAFPGSCVPANTLISMADGTTKKIVDVKEGDMVLCYPVYGSINRRFKPTGRVNRVISAGTKEIYEIQAGKRTVRASGNHPLVRMTLLNDTDTPLWTRADNLNEGNVVATLKNGDLNWEKITSIKKVGSEATYDLSIDKYHNFFADGFLVHNSGGGVFLRDGKYVGMLVRGGGETFNLIVPVRRISSWTHKMGLNFILDPSIATPTEEQLKKIPIEDTGKVFLSERTTSQPAEVANQPLRINFLIH